MMVVPRLTLAGAMPDRLYFARVHEDPELELQALRPGPDDVLVVVASAGCTALALLGAGAGRVDAVDLNPTQNHLIELKVAALATLAGSDAARFLGGLPAPGDWRREIYIGLRGRLGPGARTYWDGHERDIRRGVLGRGVSERFIGMLRRVLRLAVHPRRRIERLLALRTPRDQRAFYRAEWDTRRWRALFRLLLGRRSLERTYDPAFFHGVEASNFGEHFRRTFERTVTELPIPGNYFLHMALTGRYAEDSLPPYLDELRPVAPHPSCVEEPATPSAGALRLVDGSVTDYLRTLPGSSVTGFALSNVCEWLDDAGIGTLFREIERTAAPGAVVCFRNFVGWTDVPPRRRGRVVEDHDRGDRLFRQDRSLVNRRFAVCRVTTDSGRAATVREARPEDNGDLVRLAAACPMRGDTVLCVDRSPDFFTLNRLQGDEWKVGVAVEPDDTIVGCAAIAARHAWLNGLPVAMSYVCDLKVHPEYRRRGVADALSGWLRTAAGELAGPDAPALLTILEGNTPMEKRADGRRGLPRLRRIATIEAWSIPLVLPRRRRVRGIDVRAAGVNDLDDMAALWNRVAPGRQLADAFGSGGLAARIQSSPWPGPEAYLLARNADGRLAGFVGLWDQHEFKQIRVLRYEPRAAALRRTVNVLAPLVGAARLPPPGESLRYLTAVHVCVPPDRPDALRALLLVALSAQRSRGYGFITIGLDANDPLNGALRGLWAQRSRIGAYLTSATGAYEGPQPDGRPVHFELALV